MKTTLRVLLVFLILFSCKRKVKTPINIRTNFTKEESRILNTAKTIIKKAYFGTFITVDKKGQPKARIMEPFAPNKAFVIWLATNPKSRKVQEIKDNPSVALHYFDKESLSYVSFVGTAFLIDDEAIKSKKFKKGWNQFYKNQKEAYLLIKFIPKTLELISVSNQFSGDSITWKPHLVSLRKEGH